MAFLKQQTIIQPQFKEYSKFLSKREGYKVGTASFFAKQLQDFVQSGLTPIDYFNNVNAKDARAAETFLSNFRLYNQFTTEQYFNDLSDLRWELGRKYTKGAVLNE